MISGADETHASTLKQLPPEQETKPRVENAPVPQWYYEHDDGIIGPVSAKKIKAAAKNGELKADARVWSSEMDNWEPAHEVFPQLLDRPTPKSGWGIQHILAALLLGIAMLSLIGVGGVYAAKPSKQETEVVKRPKIDPKPLASRPLAKGEAKSTDAKGPDAKGPDAKGPDTKGSEGPSAPIPTKVKDLVVLATTAGDPEKRVQAVNDLRDLGAKARSAVPKLIPLLDDPDDRLARATWAALEVIGTAPEDLGAIEKALVGDALRAKQFALRCFAQMKPGKIERKHLPGIVAALDAKEAEIREAALEALLCYGPDCKPEALKKLFGLLRDLDPAVVRLTLKTLTSFLPFEGRDREVLVDYLKSPDPAFRKLALYLLAENAPDEDYALRWFRPLLKDESPVVREQAIVAIAKWGKKAKNKQPDILQEFQKLTEDRELIVQTAAARGLGSLGGGPDVVKTLEGLLDPKTELGLRSAAIQALFLIEFPTPAKDMLVLESLLTDPDPTIRAGAFFKLASLGEKAAAMLKFVAAGLSDPDAEVRAAALRVVAAVGIKATDLAPQVAELATNKFDVLPATNVEAVPDRLLRSTVWIYAEDSITKRGWSGAGVLVDRQKRLVLTTSDVANRSVSLKVFFPYAPNGKLLNTPADYLGTKYAHNARVDWAEPTNSLVLVQFDGAPPAEARAITFAAEPAKKGQKLFARGHSATELWRVVIGGEAGIISNMSVIDKPVEKCLMLETGMSLTSEDKGGAVVNDRGELIGVNYSMLLVDGKRHSYAIDLSVVRTVPGVIPADAVSTKKLALDTLALLGTKGGVELANFLKLKLSVEMRAAVIDRLGTLGADFPASAATQLLTIAEKDVDSRAKIREVLIQNGTDEVCTELYKRYDWSTRNQVNEFGVVVKTRFSKGGYSLDYHLWILELCGNLRVKNLSDKGKRTLLDLLTRGKSDPEEKCKTTAKQALDNQPLLTAKK